MKKNYYFVVLLFLFLTVFFSWKFFKGQTKPFTNRLMPVQLAFDWTPNTNHTGIYVALAKGWYKDQRIDLKILPYSPSVSSSVLVASGKADVGISFIEDVVGETAQNNPIVSIGAIVQHNTSG